MPYIEVDELREGQVAADVVSREDYDSVADELGRTAEQRDTLIEHVTSLESDLAESKKKYADTFISTRARAGAPQGEQPKPKKEPKHKTTYDSLFK